MAKASKPKPEPAISLRDYFAGQIMQAMVAKYGKDVFRANWIENVADDAFNAADVMVKRSKRTKPKRLTEFGFE